MGNIQGLNTDNNGINFDKKELKILYKNFIKLDQDHSGTIEPNEFFDVPELQDNPIVQRIISVFDKNNDGKISFYEFVTGLSTLTDSGKLNKLNFKGNIEDKNRLAFQVYDVNGDGFISNGDLYKSLNMLVGDNLTEIQIQQLVDRTIIMADKDQDGKISYEEFSAFVKDIKIGDMFSYNFFYSK